jgi:glutathione S-transferase
VVYDSHVICEYLDSLRPEPKLFPAGGRERLKALTLGALSDGIAEAGILIVYEKRFRPEDKYVQSWIDRQQAKIDAGLDHLERDPPAWTGHPNYGHIALAAALGHLDLRHAGKWRERRPKLVAWLVEFAAAVPAFNTTRPQG